MAWRTGTHERYLSEWLAAQAASSGEIAGVAAAVERAGGILAEASEVVHRSL
ncbi:hypothetical protein [Singulisphaera sp. Ch08]|uniref:hypothetical protein n=1 Tax=Singulisphaera sp. Ch08 TaxID=3120278 RepID=UPI00387393FB